MSFAGAHTALVTPFRDGQFDIPAFQALIEEQIAGGISGIIPVGTTGESPTLDHDEHLSVIKVAIETAAGRCKVIAGTGSNSTAEAIDLTQAAEKAGADAALLVVPYYNKPTQEGIYQHFKAIAEAVDLPVVLYNVPGRTVADMAHDTVMRLTQVPGIVGIKEATGDIARALHLIKDAPKDFAIYSGDDPTAVALILLGGHGNISVTANVAPKAMSEICAAALAGDAKTAAAKQLALMPLHKALFIEANPIPVKWAAARMGLCQPGLRLPLTPLSDSCHATVEAAMKTCGLI